LANLFGSVAVLINRAQSWFATNYQRKGRDLVFTPALVNIEGGENGNPLVRCSFEIRSIDSSVLDNFKSFIDGLVQVMNDDPNKLATVDVAEITISAPVQSDQGVFSDMQEMADSLNVRCNTVISGAGHDTSTYIRGGYPGIVVLTKQPKPISHNPDEAHTEESFTEMIRLLIGYVQRPTSELEGADNYTKRLKDLGAN